MPKVTQLVSGSAGLRAQAIWLQDQALVGRVGSCISSHIELIIFVRGFSHAESKSEVHVFHDPGWRKRTKLQQAMGNESESVYFGGLLCERDLLNE